MWGGKQHNKTTTKKKNIVNGSEPNLFLSFCSLVEYSSVFFVDISR